MRVWIRMCEPRRVPSNTDLRWDASTCVLRSARAWRQEEDLHEAHMLTGVPGRTVVLRLALDSTMLPDQIFV